MLFDLWGTLIIEEPAIADARVRVRIEWLREALAALGHAHSADAIEAALASADAEHGRIKAAERDISARGRTVLALQHLDPALAASLDDAAWEKLDEAMLTPALAAVPPVAPGTAAALAEVKSLGLATALVSNAGTTPGYVLSRVLDNYGLLRYLDVTIYSDEVEMAKPAPGIFACALDALGVEPPEAAFVGDEPALDVFGARRAGLWTVQIGDRARDGIEPHARIASLDALVPALRELRLLQ